MIDWLKMWEDAVDAVMFACTDFFWSWLLVLARRMLLTFWCGEGVVHQGIHPLFIKSKMATEIIHLISQV